MRILIVASYLPFPLFSGGAVRLYNLIKELSKHHKITLVAEIRPNQTQADVKELEKLCEAVYTVPRKKQWSTENIIRSGFSTYPFLLQGHTLPEMKEKIVSILNEKRFDVIHVETFYVYQNLPKTYLPIVLVEHNIEYQVYERYMATARKILRPLLFIDIGKIKFWEEKYWRRATRLVAVSEVEKKEMKREDVVVVPNGVDLTKFKIKNEKIKKEKKERRILFMGDFRWIQNQISSEFILKEIWPVLRQGFGQQASKKDTAIKLWIVGKNIPESLKGLGDSSVIFDENAPDDTTKIYQKADILLAPIFVGGGTSYKILEAMASGVPVVTTHLGVVGLGAKDKKEALIGETAKDLTGNVSNLLQNEKLYVTLAENARKLIEEKYSWEIIAQKLEDVYKSVI